MKHVKFLAAAGMMILSVHFANAQRGERGQGMERGERPSPEKIFEKMDTNGDGRISEQEFQDMPAPRKERGGQRGQRDNERTNNDRRPDKSEVFDRLDTNGNGYISLQEFREGAPKGRGGMKGMKRGQNGERGDRIERRNRQNGFDREETTMTWKQAKTMFKQADVNKDKKVSAQEFAEQAINRRGSQQAFNRLDTDDDGYLTKKELKKALK